MSSRFTPSAASRSTIRFGAPLLHLRAVAGEGEDVDEDDVAAIGIGERAAVEQVAGSCTWKIWKRSSAGIPQPSTRDSGWPRSAGDAGRRGVVDVYADERHGFFRGGAEGGCQDRTRQSSQCSGAGSERLELVPERAGSRPSRPRSSAAIRSGLLMPTIVVANRGSRVEKRRAAVARSVSQPAADVAHRVDRREGRRRARAVSVAASFVPGHVGQDAAAETAALTTATPCSSAWAIRSPALRSTRVHRLCTSSTSKTPSAR